MLRNVKCRFGMSFVTVLQTVSSSCPSGWVHSQDLIDLQNSQNWIGVEVPIQYLLAIRHVSGTDWLQCQGQIYGSYSPLMCFRWLTQGFQPMPCFFSLLALHGAESWDGQGSSHLIKKLFLEHLPIPVGISYIAHIVTYFVFWRLELSILKWRLKLYCHVTFELCLQYQWANADVTVAVS